jgi:hypothetical protein
MQRTRLAVQWPHAARRVAAEPGPAAPRSGRPGSPIKRLLGQFWRLLFFLDAATLMLAGDSIADPWHAFMVALVAGYTLGGTGAEMVFFLRSKGWLTSP